VKPIRVLLVEDHTLVRAGIRSLLQSVEWILVVAEASNGREALLLADEHEPDVVLMDIAMKGLNGIEATSRLIQKRPKIRVLILSMHMNEEYILQALRAGAAGYLLKDAEMSELEFAIQAVVQGKTYLSPSIAEHVVEYVRFAENQTDVNRQNRLTPRQREVLQLIAEGNTTKAIAEQLHISVNTVETHRKQLMDTLNIHEITGLVKYALRTGLTSSEE
jgi:DNA-binding NarL/FixJ family response regulator